jgi:hypothetical protein
MTAIAGLVHEGKVCIGADSASVDTSGDIILRKDVKVFKLGSDFIVGYISSFRMGQLLRFTFKPPSYEEPKDVYEYMCTSFIDELRKCFRDGGEFLIGHRGRLFNVQPDYQIAEVVCEYNACGCGYPYILISFYTSRQFGIVDPIIRVKTALHAAETFSAGVRGSFNIEIL